jgi:WD40 repeat protein/energy-coupling factor transporter ATP-binding protein EcfA2
MVTLPPPGARLNTIAQLACCNFFLRANMPPSSAAVSTITSPDPTHQASVDALLQNEEEMTRIRWLSTRVVEEFAADSLKSSEKISEVVLLGPTLDKEHHRNLLNCMITGFEAATLLNTDLLQGLVQLVQCAGPNYLLPDDLIHILAFLRTRLRDTHLQSTEYICHLTLALSRLLDVMVEGKVQDLRRVVDHEPLSALLGQLANNADPYLKHLAVYALQALFHVPNDESRRQLMLRQAGSITMGLLGVASVCKLDLGELRNGVDHLYKAAGDAHEVVTKVFGGIQSLLETGQDIVSSVKGGMLSGGRRLWYTALREAQEHVRNGRLADFNHLVFEAPCHRDVEFQWGVCKILGEIALDPQWEIIDRQHAVELLHELYKNDTIWPSNEEVDAWILCILRQIVALPDPTMSHHAQSSLQGLEKEGSAAKQDLYRGVLACPLSPYPIKIRLPVPPSSPLLTRVLAIPDVEYDIHRLRAQRLKERGNPLFIPPQAKPTLQSSDDTLFPLVEKVLEFVAGPGQVLLLLGDSGGGKSTFNLQLEYILWKEYKCGGLIPLYINLPAIDNPQDEMVDKQLRRLHLFSDAQIHELRQSRQFIVICDGYDESQLKRNLYATNQFNKIGQWRVKVIISCRTQYLGSDYRSQFQPTVERYDQPTVDLFQEAVLAPLSRRQIEQYVEQYVQRVLPLVAAPDEPTWDVDEYMDKLMKIPNLIDLVSNPFLLTLALRALPGVVRSKHDLFTIRLTRVGLYDSFIEEWLENNKRRLEDSSLSLEAQSTFDILREEGFVQLGISFQKDLAEAIFQHQHGNPVVEYTHLRERHTWKASFFSPDTQTAILREASPLARSGKQFRFLHRSILEYLYSRVMSDPADPESATNESSGCFVSHPLNQRNIVNEPSVLQFLAERVELDPSFKSRLFAAIEDSKSDSTVSQAAANAISILIRADVRFNGADLRGIRIPGADLRGGQFDSADLEGADLSGVNLGTVWLRQANLSRSQMTRIQFGELPYLQLYSKGCKCVFSSDGELLAVSTTYSRVTIFCTGSWTKIASYRGGYVIAISPTTREIAMSGQDNTVELGDIMTGKARLVLSGHEDEVFGIAYSPDGSRIATAGKDTTVRVWSTLSGNILHTLIGHSESVSGVAFSPTGPHLVSCSRDKSLRAWNMQTGELMAILEGHQSPVYCMAYSYDGRQIASGDGDGNVLLWDAITWKDTHCLRGHRHFIFSIAYSLDGGQIASCGFDMIIRIWDSHNGESLSALSGHLDHINSVAYSPTGDCTASGSEDGAVRLWRVGGGALSHGASDVDEDRWECVALSPNGEQVVTGGSRGRVQFWETRTGKPGLTITEHAYVVGKMAFSPCGQRIVGGCSDHAVRLWCAHTGATLHVFRGHTSVVYIVVFSPDGRHILSAGEDTTIRTWDCETGESGISLEGHNDEINGVAYSPNGRQIASSSEDKTVRLWSAQTGKQLLVLDNLASVYQLMYSADSRYLTTFEVSSCILHFWDTSTGKSVGQQKMSSIQCCCSSPDRRLLASGTKDGLLQLWDRSSGAFVKVFQSAIGWTSRIQWVQGVECTYLSTFHFNAVRVWKPVENNDNKFDFQLLWCLGKKELSLADANLTGVIGLSSVDLKLVKQRGAITELKGEDEDENDDKAAGTLDHEE